MEPLSDPQPRSPRATANLYNSHASFTHVRALCFALFVGLSLPTHAQQPGLIALHLDPATTHIRWTLDTTLHIVHGTFQLKSGDISIDPATGEASGLIVIDAASGDSADAARDRRMHSAVLESRKYPEITFRPRHIDGRIDLASPVTVTVDGIFSLHGQDHPLALTIHLRPDPRGTALATRFTIPFVAWGLKDPSTFLFRTAKEVAIDIDALASRAP